MLFFCCFLLLFVHESVQLQYVEIFICHKYPSFECKLTKVIFCLGLPGFRLFLDSRWVIYPNSNPKIKIVKFSRSYFFLCKKCVLIGFKAIFLEIRTINLTILYMYPNRMCIAAILSYQARFFIQYSKIKKNFCLKPRTPVLIQYSELKIWAQEVNEPYTHLK